MAAIEQDGEGLFRLARERDLEGNK